MDFEEALSYIEGLGAFGMKPGLERIGRLLELLGNPQEGYRSVHITGTNGKGSVSAMMANILRESSLRTGLFTSPHLLDYRERIQVNGEPIDKTSFAGIADEIRCLAERMVSEGMGSPTQFEVLTAMAFAFFAKEGVEWAVVEAGLGGLLDSTNVIIPELSVITNVTMEHADKCGGTLEGIAKHKAGIIKERVPIVTGAKGMPLAIILDEAEKKHSEAFVIDRDFSARAIGSPCFAPGYRKSGEMPLQRIEFASKVAGIPEREYSLKLMGDYQIENGALALMSAAVLMKKGFPLSLDAAGRALSTVEWPCRFECLTAGGKRVIVDGAHNPAGMAALRRSLDTYDSVSERVYILGILRDKDIPEMIGTLLRPGDRVVVTAPDSDRAAAPEILLDEVKRITDFGEIAKTPLMAVERSLDLMGKDSLLIVAGSLYLVGKIKKTMIEKRSFPE